MYDGYYGINTINSIQSYYGISPFNLTQQCCNVENMAGKLQTQQTINNLQSQMQKIKDIDTTINIPAFKIKEEIRGNERNNPFDKSIENYMNKEFLYESELKEIEEEFNFSMGYILNQLDGERKEIFKICENIINEADINKNIVYVYISSLGYILLRLKDQIFSMDVDIDKKYLHIFKRYDNNELIKIFNSIINSSNLEYQQFCEKYKNRIVKDNTYEDLSFYEKILEENA